MAANTQTKSRYSKAPAALTALLVFIGSAEGLRQKAYLDPVGIPTACFGETKNIRMGMSFTLKQCQDMLGASVLTHEQGMRRCLARPDDIPILTYGAALSMAYNVGVGAFCGSSLRGKLNVGDWKGACAEFPKWNKVTLAGRKIALPGLTKRRAAEQVMCYKGAMSV